VAAAGAVAGMLFAGGAAHAVTDTIFRYSTPKTGFVTIQSIAFNPDASGTAFHSAIQLTLDVAGAACFLAPVNMPQGAKMSALQIWYKRATPNFFTVALFRQHITQESSADVIVSQTPPGGGFFRPAKYDITDTALQTVDNSRYSYFLRVCMAETADSFQNARVTFTYNNAGD
jgi:hypothetical protein